MSLASLYRKIVPEKIRGKLFNAKNFVFYHDWYDKYNWKETKLSYGEENPDKTFFVIRKYSRAVGLLSCYLTMLSRLKADVVPNPYIPVADMQSHFYNLIHNKKDKGKNINGWEYYFCKMSDYGMDDIKKSKNVILSDGGTPDIGLPFFYTAEINNELLSQWYDIDAKYFRLQPELQERFDKSYDELLKGKRVLATIVREGYMVLAAARDAGDKDAEYIGCHSKQPSMEEIMDDVEKRMKAWNCDYVFVSAETTLVIEEFKKRFGDKAIFSDRERREIDNLENIEDYRKAGRKIRKSHDTVSINKDYLEEVYLMSKCTCLCAGKCSASVVAAIWNRGKYENMEIIQKGLY